VLRRRRLAAVALARLPGPPRAANCPMPQEKRSQHPQDSTVLPRNRHANAPAGYVTPKSGA